MKKSTKWLIVLAATAIFLGQYGYIMYSWLGIDIDGYTADKKGKKVAYKLHGAYKQAEIDGCFRKLGVDPDKLDGLLRKIKSGALTPSPALKRCIELKAEGYASPKKDLKKITAFLDHKDDNVTIPKLIREVNYNPRECGIGGMTISIPQGYSRYECSGKYHQIWERGGSGRWVGCTGIYSDRMPNQLIRQMPVEDPRLYGKVLVNTNDTTVSINLNIPQRYEEYSDIDGNLTLKFYK